MMRLRTLSAAVALVAVTLAAPSWLSAQRGGRGSNPFPGGTNEDGSLRPTRPLTGLFTQNAYTQYEILEPGSESFRIKYLPETPRTGATEIVNATRGGSEGTGIEVYDPRTGEPIAFTYEEQGNDSHAIHAPLPFPVPEGGIGRVLIFKTYTDPRTYIMNGDDIAWVRSLSGYRLGVVLPKGFAVSSVNVAAQLSTLPDGRLKLSFANPSGLSNPFTLHATPTTTAYPPTDHEDMFFDDVKTLYDLAAPATGQVMVEQIYSDYRRGEVARLDSLRYLSLGNLVVTDLDTAKPLETMRQGADTVARLEVPITREYQSAHLKLTGVIDGDGYRADGDGFVFERTVHGLRNTILLPEGYEVQSVSQSGTIGRSDGRVFVSLINLNGENNYTVTIRGQRTP